MHRLTGVILAILGVVLLVGGLYPSGLLLGRLGRLGRLNGVGNFGGHGTAGILVFVGAVALVIGMTLRVPSRPS
jgi:hypothetical protein